MSVTDCHTLVDSPSPSLDLEWPELYLMILKSELRSAHPLARGIASWCEEKAKTVAGERVEVLKLSYIAGKGLEAELSINKGSERKSCRLLVGTADLMTSRGLVLGTKVSFEEWDIKLFAVYTLVLDNLTSHLLRRHRILI